MGSMEIHVSCPHGNNPRGVFNACEGSKATETFSKALTAVFPHAAARGRDRGTQVCLIDAVYSIKPRENPARAQVLFIDTDPMETQVPPFVGEMKKKRSCLSAGLPLFQS